MDTLAIVLIIILALLSGASAYEGNVLFGVFYAAGAIVILLDLYRHERLKY